MKRVSLNHRMIHAARRNDLRRRAQRPRMKNHANGRATVRRTSPRGHGPIIYGTVSVTREQCNLQARIVTTSIYTCVHERLFDSVSIGSMDPNGRSSVSVRSETPVTISCDELLLL